MINHELILLLKYVVLGFIQGFTEPLPISSSGHLILLQHFIHVRIEGLSFEVLVHFASLIAVILVYKKELLALFCGCLRYIFLKDERGKKDFHFVVYIGLATVPAVVIALLFEDVIAAHFTHIRIIAVTLFVTGIALWVIRHLRGHKSEDDVTLKEAVVVGFAQAVALLPGISRSGATIVAAMLLGWKRETALRFSFFLFIPISLGGGVLAVSDIIKDPHIHTLFIPYTVAFISSLLATYYALKLFIRVMESGKLIYFSVYCLAAGALLTMIL